MPARWPTRTLHRRNSTRPGHGPRARSHASSAWRTSLGTPTRRRAGVYRRAIRREASRLRDHRRVIAIVLLSLIFSLLAAGMIGRGEAAGADARAYWAGVRIWLNGGDPYHPTGPFLPYVYAPWMLPLFAPWALLPWDVAWVVWRGGTILLLLWTVHWAYRRRPLTTRDHRVLLAFPVGANLDTGNINLQLTLMLWAAQFTGPRLGGLLWALATWMKWVPGRRLARSWSRGRTLWADLAGRRDRAEHRPAAADDPASSRRCSGSGRGRSGSTTWSTCGRSSRGCTGTTARELARRGDRARAGTGRRHPGAAHGPVGRPLAALTGG